MVEQYGFGGIARRILMTKVSPPGSGPDGSRSRTGYDRLHFPIDVLTFSSVEDFIHAVNPGSRVSRFGVYDHQHSFWLPVTEGDQGGTMAW